MIKYFRSHYIENQIKKISQKLNLPHDINKIPCIRSKGSKSKYIIARCHTISKAVQVGLGLDCFYVIEIISENYDNLPKEEKIKTLIHELMHIPKAFGGGFKGHRWVNKKTVEKMYKMYKNN